MLLMAGMDAPRRHASAGVLRRSVLRYALACAAMAVCAFGAAPAPAQNRGGALERSVKAAFLYKFLGYTEFPASAFAEPGAPIVIGVLGSEDMATELSRIVAGRNVNNRPIVVKLLRENEAPGGVHLLFIAGADSARVARLLKAAPPGPVLLVTECDNGLLLGSVINFKLVEDRVRFDVSLEAAEKNNVKLSSRLLTVANYVQKGAP
jgi:hypothetical protein